jgi:hypothetical protein
VLVIAVLASQSADVMRLCALHILHAYRPSYMYYYRLTTTIALKWSWSMLTSTTVALSQHQELQ